MSSPEAEVSGDGRRWKRGLPSGADEQSPGPEVESVKGGVGRPAGAPI